ncbi:SulP family inorganic anion transporter [Thiorhodovibrio winogradskyi]|uniref:SulP family inorganic anion transporter n=1 Tax=Thiorhodovibrio winogradskyi TaxID=77007 RepID=UPI0038B45C73
MTTSILSLPLALAFGVASGAGPQAGLYGAVCVGLFAALFGGSTRLISEPTGPMTVVMTAVITSLMARHPEHGMAMAFTVVMVAGAFQMLIGFMKLGRFITLMPYAVISGFMSGIGIILILMQLPPMLGQAAPPGGALATLDALPGLIQELDATELLLGGLAFCFLLLFPVRWRRFCPPQLLVLLIGTAVVIFFTMPGSLRTIGEIPMGLPSLMLPSFTPEEVTRILLDGIVLGTLGAIDTLLTAMIADSLTREQHDSNRELVGQGLGNILSGLLGGLPGAGATMGTVANIQTGAKTILAGVIRALLLLVVVLWAAPLLADVPMAILSAIAMKVGIDILDWSFLKRVHRVSRTSTILMYSVMLLTVFFDLIVAVGFGVFLANLLTIQKLSELPAHKVKAISILDDGIEISDEDRVLLETADGQILLFQLSGPMIFGVAKAISREHAAIANAKVLILDMTDVPLMGTSVSLVIETMAYDVIAAGGQVMVAGAGEPAKKRLRNLKVFDREEVLDYPDRHTAVQAAMDVLRKRVRNSASDRKMLAA